MLTGLSVQGPATGRYNCHGLVFASRRTNIPPCGFTDAVSIDDILRRDIYQKVRVPQLGDIAIYRNDAGEVDHSGIVCRTENIGSTGKVFVWSKWGALEEYEHPELGCPYADCKLEYWRLKQ